MSPCQKTRRCQIGRSSSSPPSRTGASQPPSQPWMRCWISISLSPARSISAGTTTYWERFQFSGSGSRMVPISRSRLPLTKTRPERLNATV